MSSLGQTLRQAREAKGLSQSKVAAETRILVQIIDDIENEDFHRIAAPIYGRGFVRLFAECVGLDPQPLIREFMDIYEGRRAPTVHVRDVPVAAAPAPQPAPPPPPEPPSPVPPVSIPEPPPRVVPVPPVVPSPEPTPAPLPVAPPPEAEPAPAVEPPPVVRGLDLFEQPAPAPVPPPARTPPPVYEESPFLPPNYEDARPSAATRFRSGLSSVSHGVVQSMRGIPRSAWRKALLAVGALAVLALLVFGCVKLYQMTTPAASDPSCEGGACTFEPPAPAQKDAAPKQAAPAKPAASSSKPAKPAPVKLRSTGQKIPPLYID